jgi:hypothetical protein
MIRLVHATVAASIAAMLTTGAAFAADEKRNDPIAKPAGVAAGQAMKPVRGTTIDISKPDSISAPNVRVALHFDPDAPGGGIVRSKGIRSIRLPSGSSNVGLYCVRVVSSIGSNARNMIPMVTADFSPGPAGQNLFAYWRSGACRSDEIGVQTQRNTGGRPVNTDLVGFSLIAP